MWSSCIIGLHFWRRRRTRPLEESRRPGKKHTTWFSKKSKRTNLQSAVSNKGKIISWRRKKLCNLQKKKRKTSEFKSPFLRTKRNKRPISSNRKVRNWKSKKTRTTKLSLKRFRNGDLSSTYKLRLQGWKLCSSNKIGQVWYKVKKIKS